MKECNFNFKERGKENTREERAKINKNRNKMRLFIATSVVVAAVWGKDEMQTGPGDISASIDLAGPTGVQGPTGMVGLSHIQASTGSLTGITGITGGATAGLEPIVNAPTGPTLAVFPSSTGSTGSMGSTGYYASSGTGATGPVEAQRLYDAYKERTFKYRQQVQELQPKYPFTAQPLSTNATIDDDVSEQRRRSRFVSYYILPKLHHMMNVPLKNELDRTQQVLNDCRDDLHLLEKDESEQESVLETAKNKLMRAETALSDAGDNVTSALAQHKRSSINLQHQQVHSFKEARFFSKRVARKYQEVHAVHEHLSSLSQKTKHQSSSSVIAALLDMGEKYPLMLHDATRSLATYSPHLNKIKKTNMDSSIVASLHVSLLEKTATSFATLFELRPNSTCFVVATCARRADVRAARTSSEVHVHVHEYLVRLAAARVEHRIAQCNAFAQHEQNTLQRRTKLQHIIEVWNETKHTSILGNVPLHSMLTDLPVPPAPVPIQSTSAPDIPVVFPPLPMLPKENKCLRLCSHQGRCAWAKEQPNPTHVYDGKVRHNKKDIAFPKEDPITMVAVCVCHDGYEGEDCGVKQCPNDCTGHGHCLDGECLCDKNWYGDACDIKENEETPHIAQRRDVETSLDSGLAYLRSSTGSEGATGAAVPSNADADAASAATGGQIDRRIGNDTHRAASIVQRHTQFNLSYTKAEHARQRAEKIMAMAEYMRLESSKNFHLEEEMQKLQDRGVVDKDALMMQRVRARQVEEAKKHRVRVILNAQEESKKRISRKKWSNKEYLTEVRERSNIAVEESNLKLLRHARLLDDDAIKKGTILGNHILNLVSDMVLRDQWENFVSPKKNARQAVDRGIPKEIKVAYEQLNQIQQDVEPENTHVVALQKTMERTLRKRNEELNKKYSQAEEEDRARLATEDKETHPLNMMAPAQPISAAVLFDDMVHVPESIRLDAAEKQRLIVVTMPSRARNETEDVEDAEKYVRMAAHLLDKANKNQHEQSMAQNLERLLSLPIPIVPTVHQLEATTNKKHQVQQRSIPYVKTSGREQDNLRRTKAEEADSMVSSASTVMRELESQWDADTTHHTEMRQNLILKLRQSMKAIDASKGAWESMEREIHHERKRHLKREEEFRKRLFNAKDDALKTQITEMYKMVGPDSEPTAAGICSERQKQPWSPAPLPAGANETGWILTDSLSAYHKCDMNVTTDDQGNITSRTFLGDSCWSAAYTMQKGVDVPTRFFKAIFDTPKLMYKRGNLGRSWDGHRKAKVVPFDLLGIVETAKPELGCFDATMNQLGHPGTASLCYFGFSLGLIPSTPKKHAEDILHPAMYYGVYQAQILEAMPPINTLDFHGTDFCITPITAPNETESCMKCPAMRELAPGSMKFALMGQLLTISEDMQSLFPNGKPAYFRHVMKIDLSSGYNDEVYFNSNPRYDIEYAVTTQLDIDTMTIVDQTLTPNGNLTLSFERDFNINNRVTAQLTQITLAINASEPTILRLRFDLPLEQVQPGDSFLYDPDITGGTKRMKVQLVTPEPATDYDNDVPASDMEAAATGGEIGAGGDSTGNSGDDFITTATGATGPAESQVLDPGPNFPKHQIPTLSRNVAQHCSKMHAEEWCASLGSIHTCGLSVEMCHALGIDHISKVDDLGWILPKKIDVSSGVHVVQSDCDIDCKMDAKARAHMSGKLRSVFATWRDTKNTKMNEKDVETRKKQHRKSAVLLRSLAHLLATGQQPTIGVMVCRPVVCCCWLIRLYVLTLICCYYL